MDLTAMNPPAAANAFLARAGWGGAQVVPLAGDASFRRYFRVLHDGRSAVLMDAPPPHEDPRPFIAIANGLRVWLMTPVIFAHDPDHGLVLIEDFGDARMREVIERAPENERSIYARVTDLLVELARAPALDLPPYDRAAYQRELALFLDWYCPAVGLKVDAPGYIAAWDSVLNVPLDGASVTVLRDYHAENVMMLADGEGIAALGLLDFQDALAGHPAYDLVSMLQDARRDVVPALEADMLDRYCARTGAGQDFRTAYHILGAQRNVKILGIFTRLWKRDHKPHYRAFQPRVWRYLERDLAHPALAAVRAWFDANVPLSARAPAWADHVG